MYNICDAIILAKNIVIRIIEIKYFYLKSSKIFLNYLERCFSDNTKVINIFLYVYFLFSFLLAHDTNFFLYF